GPSIGGLLIKVFGAANALLADALSFFLAAAAWFSLGPRPSEAMAEVGWRAQLVAGLRWVIHQRVILENTLSAVVLNIVFTAITTVFVFYAQHELRLDAARTGLVLGLAGLGPIGFASLAPRLRRRFRLGQLLLGELLITGPLLALLDVAPLLPAVPALLLASVSLGLAFGSGILSRIVVELRPGNGAAALTGAGQCVRAGRCLGIGADRRAAGRNPDAADRRPLGDRTRRRPGAAVVRGLRPRLGDEADLNPSERVADP